MKWNFRERMTFLQRDLLSVMHRHPLELLLLLAQTVAMIVWFELKRDPDLPRLLLCGWWAQLLLIVNLSTGRSRWRRIYWVAWIPLVPLLLWSELSAWVDTDGEILTFAILTLLALLACRRALSNERFVADALVYLRAAVLACLFTAVAYGLFCATLWSTAYVFGFAAMLWVKHLMGDLLLLMLFFAAPVLFLMMCDRWEGSRFRPSRVLEILLNGIVSPAVFVYAVILYLYLLKILFTWSLPEGGVAYLVFGFTMTALIVKALRLQLEKTAFNWFFDRFSLLSIPTIALFWVGVARRIGEYGLTEPRIYLLVCGAVMTFCVVLFLSRRTGRYFWVVLFAMVLFAAVVFIPALDPARVALRSQSRRIERLAGELGRLDAATGHLLLVPVSPADTVYRKTYRELYGALNYVENDSTAFARFGIQSSDDLMDLLPAAMRDYVKWGWEESPDLAEPEVCWVELPQTVFAEVGDCYSRCYVNLAGWDTDCYVLKNDTLRFFLGTGSTVLEISGTELLKKQLAESGFDPTRHAAPTLEQRMKLLDYRDARCRILFRLMAIERRDSVNVIRSAGVHTLWLR